MVAARVPRAKCQTNCIAACRLEAALLLFMLPHDSIAATYPILATLQCNKLAANGKRGNTLPATKVDASQLASEGQPCRRRWQPAGAEPEAAQTAALPTNEFLI